MVQHADRTAQVNRTSPSRRSVAHAKACDILTSLWYHFLLPDNWYQKSVKFLVPIFASTYR